MSQFILISNSHLHIIMLFILFLIVASNSKISASSIYRKNDYLPQSLILDSDSDDADQSRILFERDNLSYEINDNEIPSKNFQFRALQEDYIPTIPRFYVRHGVIKFIPHKKRTIPLELQRALYAHGIVGRRR